MARRLIDIQKDIDTCTAACVNDRKLSFWGFFTNERRYEPECRQECNNRYAAELSAAQQLEGSYNEALKNRAINDLSGNTPGFEIDKKQVGLIVMVFLFIIAIVYIIN